MNFFDNIKKPSLIAVINTDSKLVMGEYIIKKHKKSQQANTLNARN
jgi:hypothetical protein